MDANKMNDLNKLGFNKDNPGYKAQATAIMVSVKMRASEHTTNAMPSKTTATRRLVR